MTVFSLIRSARAGAVALEFGLLATAFIGLLLGVFELGFLMFAQISLDYATASSARALFTGQVSIASGTSQATFQSVDFCSYLSPLVACGGVLIVLQPVTNFQMSLSTQTAPTNGTTVNPGGPGSLMMMEAFYTPGIAIWPLNLPTLTSTAAFVNEY
jgi:Flp pilus assembly protein TadG